MHAWRSGTVAISGGYLAYHRTGGSGPTLLIYGERDRGGIVTRQLAEEAVLLNPNISTVQITGAGHNIRRENFPDFLAAVHTFLIAPH